MSNPPVPEFLTARWVHLIMASYEVDPAILRARVPRGTDLDVWARKCFVTVVGFQFLDTRVLGVPVPFHRDFEEVNLRLYVRRVVGGEVRHGVVFVKEIVRLRAVAWIANALDHEKYVMLPMSHTDRTGDSPPSLVYRWRHRGRWSHLAATLDGGPYLPDAHSEEAFITEHPWGYTRRRDGSTLEYQVEHPRWKVWRARDPELACDVEALYGREFVPYLKARPSSCYVADGSEVIVRRGARS